MSNTVEDLMELSAAHARKYRDWTDDGTGYKEWRDANVELNAAITTALREQYEAGIAASAEPSINRYQSTYSTDMVLAPKEPTEVMLNAAAPFPEHLRAEHPDPADPWHELMRAATATDQAVARSTYLTMIAAREAEPS